MAPLRYAAKFDPFLSLDCARVEGVGAQSKFCHLATLEAEGDKTLRTPTPTSFPSFLTSSKIFRPIRSFRGQPTVGPIDHPSFLATVRLLPQ